MAKHIYKTQESDYTCGPVSIRNCLLHSGVKVSEYSIRKVCGTKKYEVANERQLKKACKHFGFNVREIEVKSTEYFRRILKIGFKQGKVYIVSTEAYNHWIPVLSYQCGKLKIVDTDYKKYVKKSIVQEITFKQLIETVYSYNKFDRQKSCYALELTYNQDGL